MTSEIERLASACLLPGFAGVTAPEWLRRELDAGLGGVLLFARNVVTPDQLAALTASLRRGRPELLVAIDEEGGDVTRLEAASGSSYPGNLALGAVDDPSLTERVARSLAAELTGVGVNLDLAPVADVNTNPQNPVIGVRSFGSEPPLVARHVAAFVTGLQRGGVAACVKHFPGHGDTELDSHRELPTVHVSREELLSGTFEPFRAAIAAGVQAVMTAHIVVPAVDAVPATISREHLVGLLREELGFEGLAITDALEMRAIAAGVGMEEGAVLALAAGADALCLGHDIDAGHVERVRGAILAAVQTGRLEPERLADAAKRVERLGRWAVPGAAVLDRAVGLEAARRAVTVEGEVVLTAPPLVVELVPEAGIAAGEHRHGLGEILAARLPGTEVVRVDTPADGEAATLQLLDGRRLVLVVRDPQRHAWERAMAATLLAAAPDAVVVDVGYPAWREQAAAGRVTTFGAGRVNLEAAVERLLAA